MNETKLQEAHFSNDDIYQLVTSKISFLSPYLSTNFEKNRINVTNQIKKYNVPVPRYTSYPTVPNWNDQVNKEEKLFYFEKAINELGQDGLSIYIHLPFCETLCTYCGCNKYISKSHSVEEKYIQHLLQEWELYQNLIPKRVKISQLHLGGGTPTFFSKENLYQLISTIMNQLEFAENADISVEGHPSYTSFEQLETLRNLGFNRVSFGVQDLDEKVQKVINRIQPIEDVRQVVKWSRELGYESINLDLVYGLPFQTLATLQRTIDEVLALAPDRIANYAYAHVPWKSKSQRLYDENDLPSGEEKRALYERTKEALTAKGYLAIGMDHFALPTDKMYQAYESGKLRRNFMGYTDLQSKVLLGLGVSSISNFHYLYVQNAKQLNTYYAGSEKGKGKILSENNLMNREIIESLMCNGEVLLPAIDSEVQQKLQEFEEEGLILLHGNHLSIQTQGKKYVRNICSVFDEYYTQQQNKYSLSI